MDKPKLFRINIYLAKDSVSKIEDLILKKYHDDQIELDIENTKEAVLIFKDPEVSTPDWFKYLEPKVDKKILSESKTSPSALLLIRDKKDRIFILSFGYGRYLLEDYRVVPDFGLKVCLNTLTGEEIKTVDKKSLESIALITRQQTVVPISFNTFDIEFDRDLVKSIDGHSDQSFGKYFKGATSLTITTTKSIEKLSELCDELYSIYKLTKYKEEFGWIDNIKYVSDVTTIDKLNSLLLKDLSAGEYANCFLGIPEMVDNSKIKFYRFAGVRDQAQHPLFPPIDQYIAGLSERNKKLRKNGQKVPSSIPTMDDLLNHKVTAYSWDDKPSRLDHWTVFNCLHAEQKSGGKIYKLLDGDWYEVDGDYLKDIETRINAIDEFKINLIDMHIGEREEIYNERLSKHLKAANLDQDFVQIEGRSKFEFCDVFLQNQSILHIKKYTGAPSISHLLYQAFISGQMYSNVSEVRNNLSGKKPIKNLSLHKEINPDKFKTSDFTIVFVIATKKKAKLNNLLSFFCKISIAHKHKVLSSMGYQVKYKIVEITSP